VNTVVIGNYIQLEIIHMIDHVKEDYGLPLQIRVIVDDQIFLNGQFVIML
jgi:hypothetical protein